MKETVGLKLNADTAVKFKEIQKEHTSAQEFIENMLSVYLEKKNETDMDSPVHKEKIKVKKALMDVERVVSAFLEIAASEKIKTIETAKIEKKAAAEKITDLEKKLDEQDTTLADLRKKYKDLYESVETISELKSAWQELKQNWENEINNLLAQNKNLKNENERLIAKIAQQEEERITKGKGNKKIKN